MNTRAQASTLITSVIHDKQSLSNLLNDQDSLTKALCHGVLRHYFELQQIADTLLTKKTRPKVLHLLLVGLYDLIYMSTPEHASVSETVNATKDLNVIWARGVINRNLREFIRRKNSLLSNSQIHHNHPQWLFDMIKDAWPENYKAILANNLKHPPLTLRVNTLKMTTSAYLKKLTDANIEASLTQLTTSGVTLTNALPVSKLPGFSQGEAYVQDDAAQVCAQLIDPQPRDQILDACAAPGGKACHLLEMQPELASLTALDNDEQRIARIHDNLSRLQLHAKVIHGDASERDWWDQTPFDKILLDAPCSATGVIRRHPDILHLRQAQDIEALAQTQLRILFNLWTMLRKGGRLLYVTCSNLPAETDEVIHEFLQKTQDASEIAIKQKWGHTKKHGRHILPGEANCDGFYYALLERT